ncbi:UTRA domain-containing protein [Dermabacter sp. p3-SID358]|uniref:UTRA domain-containing protein n=1 Tax=Dermabacter sp. p3-SID358 TaxID=2916114 RepID=UPI0021A59C5D|nr:UTRA domain-containing protein [Dermabacter sp. p3-SID358]MCT1867711.1 UTRA domain-containing protein [Dermabacter sp. p3-SID358]
MPFEVCADGTCHGHESCLVVLDVLLHVPPRDGSAARSRLVKREGRPTHSLTSYYRESDVAGTPPVDPTPGPAGRGGGFAVLTLQGLEPHEVTEAFSSRMPTPDEIALLEIPAGEPVMVMERTVRTATGHPVEFAIGVHRASLFSWQYTFEMPD